MRTSTSSAPRLWILLARETPVAAILRRGPSRQVQLIRWNREDDTFEHGQWFKGRIYERRCDLSPDGTLLIYFAATWKGPLHSWTAVSKVPWFTALALWPKGDGWNGGGYFTGSREIHLNHLRGDDTPHSKFVVGCRKLRITSHAEGFGEDATVWEHTLKRDGWRQAHPGEWSDYGEIKRVSWKALAPEQWQKPHPKRALRLEMSIEGIGQENGPWWVTTYRVASGDGSNVVDLGMADWADWDPQGDLLFARNGRLYRQPFLRGVPDPASELADFNASKFKAVPPPPEATVF